MSGKEAQIDMDIPESAHGQIFKHEVAANEDIAAAYADALEGENAYSRKEEVRLRWKLDIRLVPILWFNITLSAIDKVSTGKSITVAD